MNLFIGQRIKLIPCNQRNRELVEYILWKKIYTKKEIYGTITKVYDTGLYEDDVSMTTDEGILLALRRGEFIVDEEDQSKRLEELVNSLL